MGYTAIDRDDEGISPGRNAGERGIISLSWNRRQKKNFVIKSSLLIRFKIHNFKTSKNYKLMRLSTAAHSLEI